MSDTPPSSADEPNVALSAEMMDREERKALKKKKKEEEQANKVEPTQDEIEAALARSKLAEAEKAKKKKMFKLGGSVAGIALIGWAGYYLFKPYEAGMTYGICKTFLELHVQFPQDLRLSTVDDLGASVRIWYTQLDAFGEYRMESIQCYFRPDDVTGAALEKVTINRREVDPKEVEEFNESIGVVLAAPLDLTIPKPLPDSLENLQIETDKFRFQLNL